ncbi:MAG: hypothetical protein CSA95_08010 [Bacteroidetes bacterium]|nr:MAG: hypothetical protein CSA95_08010 [Bacteroidota bacterium]
MFYTYISFTDTHRLHDIGVTSNLQRRLKNLNATKKARESLKIVYYECFDNSRQASLKEDQWRLMSEKELISQVKNNNPLFINLVN